MTFGCYNKLNMLQGYNYDTANPNFYNGSVTGSLFAGVNSIYNYNPFQQMMVGNNCGTSTNCNGEPNWNAMLGLGIAGAVMSTVQMFIGQAGGSRRENSTEALNKKADKAYNELEKAKDKLDTEQNKLKTLNEALPDLETKTKQATADYNEADSYIKNNETAYKAAKANKNNNKIPTDEEKIIISNYEEYKSKLPGLERAKKAAEDAVKAQKEKIEAQKDKIDDIKEDIKALEEDFEIAEEDYEDSILDKADGRSIQRTRESAFAKLFDENGNFITTRTQKVKDKSGNITEVSENVKVRKSDVRYAILGYRNAKTEEERNKWAYKFQQLYNQLSEEDKENKNLSAAYGIICG